ncbi:MAG: TlpA family protein disulfide reductase [Acidobacteria bacterium]|nr:TlpA family protein disulfide reductase [Acidobacteriota bacterium]
MLKTGEQAPRFSLYELDGRKHQYPDAAGGSITLIVFFETDCPTCRLTFPYISQVMHKTGADAVKIIGISQDDEASTREFVEQLSVKFPVVLDHDLNVTRQYDPMAVPTLFLIDREGKIFCTQVAFDKTGLNNMAALISAATGKEQFVIAEPFDGNPETKPGCVSRHLEPQTTDASATPAELYTRAGSRASRIELADDIDPFEYCLRAGFDPLPVVPPTPERVERMLRSASLAPDAVVAQVPPNYGQATVEKVAANAVMAGCQPEMMRVLIPLVRAACDERFNLHGVQATTHFAAPLVIINGPLRGELGFAFGSNVFSNVTRANSTLGRALQLILANIGGARPGEIDMSTLGNPGKFAYCIAENEEENPWEPLHVELGFKPEQSTVTLFAAEPPRGVSEHTARSGRTILKTISRVLATIWSYRVCAMFEAFVILCPEHVKTLHRDGFTKARVREFLYENTGIPQRAYEDDGGEGTQYVPLYDKILIDGEPCYRKFRAPEQIKIVVAGGTAGKFSAVIGSWATGPRGSQVVTYPIE